MAQKIQTPARAAGVALAVELRRMTGEYERLKRWLADTFFSVIISESIEFENGRVKRRVKEVVGPSRGP